MTTDTTYLQSMTDAEIIALNTALPAEIGRLFNGQMSIKIMINSCYGALGNRYFRHYDLRMAEGITLTGQLIIRWAEKAINAYMNKAMKTTGKDYVIYVDTDSNYVDLSGIVELVQPDDPAAFIDDFCKEVLAPVLDEAFKELGAQQQTFKPRISMSREIIADVGFWTSKKHYALRMLYKDDVRLSKPKLKILGLAAVKSGSSPAAIREWLKEIVDIILTGDAEATQRYIAECREKFVKLTPEQMANPRSVSDIGKYAGDDRMYIKGTPFNVRASMVYNKAITDAGLTNRYELISNGDKIKYIYLRLPNKCKENIIAFPDMLPRELDLERFIDVDTQFEKTFLNEVEMIMTAIGWSIEETTTLEGLFC